MQVSSVTATTPSSFSTSRLAVICLLGPKSALPSAICPASRASSLMTVCGTARSIPPLRGATGRQKASITSKSALNSKGSRITKSEGAPRLAYFNCFLSISSGLARRCQHLHRSKGFQLLRRSPQTPLMG